MTDNPRDRLARVLNPRAMEYQLTILERRVGSALGQLQISRHKAVAIGMDKVAKHIAAADDALIEAMRAIQAGLIE